MDLLGLWKDKLPPERERCRTLYMSHYTLRVAACTVNEPVQSSCSRQDPPIDWVFEEIFHSRYDTSAFDTLAIETLEHSYHL